MHTLDELIASLRAKGVLKSARIARAFGRVDRKDFVPAEFVERAYDDTALPIGEGQTISQPYTVVFMLELLAPEASERIVDVGYGSGWQTALLAELVGKRGRVYAIELLPNRCASGKANVEKYPALASRVDFYCENAAPGLPAVAREVGGFDGIIAAAEVREVPPAWREQLKIGGRLVYPRASSIFREVKKADGAFDAKEYAGFAFVPFVEGGAGAGAHQR
ncbi:MAG: hypothetical protein A3A44_00895 [Candidatus Sungbacteria bacterium RIFCSPLOWO2_01_FULL_60_25]|uniref:Protein-L-isoaspartate O-methyltransferase n=1 Tax=Candidatus Sungbacteria bacterium RIFCSPLOWO2_01_FULL_60_25 TaxID=1802281 RepID=A0A1G2LA54_9BACT|nr:MAG: hypothetical protein A3A44_00895 [Candidatus Sungbacteria bacterium RIFCSPLOWO2_01_FULL_60_25]